MALLRGEAMIALTTIPAQDKTKTAVIKGCPAVR
jgi:hypothetical protein